MLLSKHILYSIEMLFLDLALLHLYLKTEVIFVFSISISGDGFCIGNLGTGHGEKKQRLVLTVDSQDRTVQLLLTQKAISIFSNMKVEKRWCSIAGLDFPVASAMQGGHHHLLTTVC